MSRKTIWYSALITTVTATQISTVSVPEVSAVTAKPIVLRFLYADSGAVADQTFVNQIVYPFNKSHPGIKVVMEFVPASELDTKTILEVNSGHSPNLVYVDSSGYNDIGILAQKGVLMSLADQFKKSKINPNIFIPAMWGPSLVNGVSYAFPAASQPTNVLWYNPAAMTAAGLNPNDPPRTWKQLYADSVKAVKFNKNGTLERVGLEISDTAVFNSYYGTFSPGGQHIWKQSGGKWIPDPVNAYNIALLTYVKKLADLYGGYTKYAKWAASDQGWNGSVDYLAKGKALFTIDGYWDYLGFNQYSPEFHYGVSDMPTPNGLPSEQEGNVSMGWDIAFPKGQSQAAFQAAWTFAVWMGVTHSYLLGPTTNGSAVLSQQKQWDQVIINNLPKDHRWFTPYVQVFTRNLEYETQYNPAVAITPYYLNALTNAVDNVLYGKQTPLQALQQVEQNVQTQMLINGGN